MQTCPYRTLMRYKRWAMNDLYAAISENIGQIGQADRIVILQLLDHIQAVDEIFSHNLTARPHGHLAPRSVELPAFETLADKARSIASWYVDYADNVTPDQCDEVIEFSFSSGAPGKMTRSEMLLHVASHSIYHCGNVGLVLYKNGIKRLPGPMTDFLASER